MRVLKKRMLLVFLGVSIFASCHAWIPSNNHKAAAGRNILLSAKAPNEESDEEKDRMALVRSLQQSFYKSDPQTPSQLDESTGIIKDLTLWRAPWWEVPGRSNVLNVHEPIYTNMFEGILRGPKPWCFGHLFLQGGIRTMEKSTTHQLQTWETATKDSESAVLGCLMNIADCRRMADGRLLLLVHAMERFVVTDIQQRLPYSIAHVQILPDAEEIDPDLDFGTLREEDLTQVRAMAIQESVRFHDYEYDKNHTLPIPDRSNLETTDIAGSAIAKVLPYCPFSKTLGAPVPTGAAMTPGDNNAKATASKDPLPSLEFRLLRRGIYQTPLIDPEFPNQRQGLSTDELEYELWLAIYNFLGVTKTPVSPVLLGMLPPHHDWPSDFALQHKVQELDGLQNADHDFVLVSPEYPAHRRQRRLAYSAAHLLETDADVANALRPQLLATPSTRQRLRLVLERFDLWQEQKWGNFQ